MKTAIIGFAGSGKTELFKALAGPGSAHAGRAMVKVPEPRLEPLTDVFKPKKITKTEIEYQDMPGSGGNKSLGNKVLSEIRGCDCFLAVLDAYSGGVDPAEQLSAIEAELIVSDMAVIEKKLERLTQDKQKAKHLYDAKEEELLKKAMESLEQEKPLRLDKDLSSEPALKGFAFLSAKPMLYAWNISESKMGNFNLPQDQIGMSHISVSAMLEREMAELDDPEELEMFMQDLGVEESALDRVIAKTYNLLNLITFLTAGEKEVRSWAISKGYTAAEAAGTIHSDIQKGFIRAEVLAWEDFLATMDMKKAKEKGVLRLEGKDYIVKDGDIITFRFNV
ncbi:MAG: YchF family ATPase [Desulfovibrionales bacterium]|nr:YchF family ATPase [Desulfovibrionales bacterium]